MIKVAVALFAMTVACHATELRVVDGDTVVWGKTKVRVVGYDTPETHGTCQLERDLAAKATARMKELVAAPNVFTLKWSKGKDKYGRGLAKLYSNGKDIGTILIAEGLAKPYDGGKKSPWCP